MTMRCGSASNENSEICDADMQELMGDVFCITLVLFDSTHDAPKPTSLPCLPQPYVYSPSPLPLNSSGCRKCLNHSLTQHLYKCTRCVRATATNKTLLIHAYFKQNIYFLISLLTKPLQKQTIYNSLSCQSKTLQKN